MSNGVDEGGHWAHLIKLRGLCMKNNRLGSAAVLTLTRSAADVYHTTVPMHPSDLFCRFWCVRRIAEDDEALFFLSGLILQPSSSSSSSFSILLSSFTIPSVRSQPSTPCARLRVGKYNTFSVHFKWERVCDREFLTKSLMITAFQMPPPRKTYYQHVFVGVFPLMSTIILIVYTSNISGIHLQMCTAVYRTFKGEQYLQSLL